MNFRFYSRKGEQTLEITKKTNYNSQTRFYPLIDALGGVSRLFNLGRIVYSLFNIIKNNTNSLLRTNHAIYAGGLPAESPCFWIFFAKDAKEGTASAPRHVRTILARQSLDSLRPENALVETARSAGQTLNSALNFPVWKLGKTFLSLIRLDINTDSLHISHNLGERSSFAPLLSIFNL